MDQLPRLGKRELICLLLFTCNYVVSVWRGFLFIWVLGVGYVISFWHSLSLPYNYFERSVEREHKCIRRTTTSYARIFTRIFYFHSRIFDEAANDRKRQENSAPRKDRQNSASNLLAHQGILMHI